MVFATMAAFAFWPRPVSSKYAWTRRLTSGTKSWTFLLLKRIFRVDGDAMCEFKGLHRESGGSDLLVRHDYGNVLSTPILKGFFDRLRQICHRKGLLDELHVVTWNTLLLDSPVRVA